MNLNPDYVSLSLGDPSGENNLENGGQQLIESIPTSEVTIASSSYVFGINI